MARCSSTAPGPAGLVGPLPLAGLAAVAVVVTVAAVSAELTGTEAPPPLRLSPPGVGVIGLPPLINSTISSASLDRSPSGRKGLSHPLSVL